jgi:Lipase
VCSLHRLRKYQSQLNFSFLSDADICSEALADPQAALKTHFLLWTRRNPTVFQLLINDDVTVLDASNYDPTNPTKIYVHGWTENGQNNLSLQMRDSTYFHFGFHLVANPTLLFFKVFCRGKIVILFLSTGNFWLCHLLILKQWRTSSQSECSLEI